MSINYPISYVTSASPQVILGDDITGLGADDARQGFRKYNNHTHLSSTSVDFYTYDIAIGDEVYIYDDNGNSVFDTVDVPVIEYISHNEVRINVTAIATIENQLLYVKAPLEDIENAIIITGVDLTEASDIITFNPEVPRGGFLTTEQHTLLASKQVTHSFNLIDGAVLAALPFILSVENTSWLKSISYYLTAGSASVSLRVTRQATGTVITSDPVAVPTTTVTTQTFTEETVDPQVEVFAGLLDNPLVTGDLVEVVLNSVDFNGASQVMLLATLNMLRVF